VENRGEEGEKHPTYQMLLLKSDIQLLTDRGKLASVLISSRSMILQ